MNLPEPTRAPESFRDWRVALVGAGIEGRDAARFLQQEGVAALHIVDRRAADVIAAELAAIDVAPTSIDAADQFGVLEHVDAIVASQGIPYDLPLLCAAAERGIPVFGPVGVFLERCPAPVIGISGSAGKTTTTTLVGQMLEADGRAPLVGGNIGRGLLAHLRELDADSTVVAEISHAQLLRTTRSPQIAALLNVTPNHLDQFSWSEYVGLKRRLVSRQAAGDTAVLPWDEPNAAAMAEHTRATKVWFGCDGSPPADADAAWLEGETLRVRVGGETHEVMAAGELLVPGRHNVRNALAAIAIVAPLGVPIATIAETLRRFEGVAHRLETVATIDGVRYINDSIATAPERTLAGVRAIEQPLVLLLGGRDKKLPLEGLLAELTDRVRAVICFGEAGATWSAQAQAAALPCVQRYDDLEAAFGAARRFAQAGDAVLLSPGGTSFDAYPNFEARGEHFRRLVEAFK